MTMEKQRRILDLLLQETKKGNVKWEETIADNTFKTSFARAALSIRQVPNEDEPDTMDHTISLYNEDGKIVETFTDNAIISSENSAKWYSKICELYELARRYALGSEQVLDDIILSLLPF